MGAVTFSIDPRLVECLLEAAPFDLFVETGTFQGDTLREVLPYFREIHSVERCPRLQRGARARFAAHAHVHCWCGESPAWLRASMPRWRDRAVLYWLDAHWCAPEPCPAHQPPCPLLDELDAIGALNDHSVLLIDDARLFLAPTALGCQGHHWPGLHDVVRRLERLGPRHQLMIVNDVIAFFPDRLRPSLVGFASLHGIDFLAAMHRWHDHERIRQRLRDQERLIGRLQAAQPLPRKLARGLAAMRRGVRRFLFGGQPRAPIVR